MSLKKSLDAVCELIKLIKHTGKTGKWLDFKIYADLGKVVVRNSVGKDILVPIDYFRWYQKLPARFLVKLTSVVREDRFLMVGVHDGENSNTVQVLNSEKYLFEQVQDDLVEEEIIFSEMLDGDFVRLKGRLVRGNESSNNVGLEYMGHTIKCVPMHGSVRQYKPALFLWCEVVGKVLRHTKSKANLDKKPTIMVETIRPLEEDHQMGLF